MSSLGLRRDGDAHAARLRGDGDPARSELLLGERGVQAARRRDDTQAVRPDDAHAVAPGGGEHVVLQAGAVGSQSRRTPPR